MIPQTYPMVSARSRLFMAYEKSGQPPHLMLPEPCRKYPAAGIVEGMARFMGAGKWAGEGRLASLECGWDEETSSIRHRMPKARFTD